MAAPKKGAMHQICFPLVDKTDFATLESALTASDLNSKIGNGSAVCKFIGWDTGGSAATTSGTLSKAVSQVHSHIFKAILKGSENNYDMMFLRVKHPSTAEQIIGWSNLHNDDSDLMSALTVIQSMASDAASAAVQANSRVLLNQSRISDMQSVLSNLDSEFGSRVPKEVSSRSQVSDVLSDQQSLLQTYLLYFSQVNSDMYSMLSDLQSDFQSRVPKETAARSQLSDLASDVKSAVTATELDASDLSDIASAVWAAKYTAHSAASSFGSLMSDVYSRVALTQSAASDAASAAQQVNSRVLLNQSRISDVYSLLSDLDSNFQSRVPKETAARSQLSDLHSDLRSYLVGMSGALSDVESQIDAGVPLDASTMSDLRSAITAGGGGAATVTASDISDIASAVWAQGVRTLTAPASATTDVTGADITRTRAATWSIAITGLGDVSTRSSPKLWFTIKSKLDGEDDSDALLQITETGGLLWLNGRSYGTPGHGSITVSDAAAGNITIAVDEDVTRQLKSANGLHYDIKMMASGTLTKLSQGKFTITNAVTLSVL